MGVISNCWITRLPLATFTCPLNPPPRSVATYDHQPWRPSSESQIGSETLAWRVPAFLLADTVVAELEQLPGGPTATALKAMVCVCPAATVNPHVITPFPVRPHVTPPHAHLFPSQDI